MDKIQFQACRVTVNKKEQNYKDYEIGLEHIKEMTLNGEKKYCKVTMLDGTVIEVIYFGKAAVVK